MVFSLSFSTIKIKLGSCLLFYQCRTTKAAVDSTVNQIILTACGRPVVGYFPNQINEYRGNPNFVLLYNNSD